MASENCSALGSQIPQQQRQEASGELLGQLRLITALVEHCARLAANGTNDAVALIQTATRASNASANLANALAKVSEAEQRQRRIIELIQPPRTAFPYSNSTSDIVEQVEAVPLHALPQRRDVEPS